MDSKEIKEKLEEHSNRIDKLEKQSIRSENRIDNLCEKLDHLIDSLDMWTHKLTTAIITAGITGVVSLMIFIIEKHI
ncbi:hemolysin XhlA family protein [Clostridium thermobutyricum]|uniref:Hemolysin XhlA n=1 Tax=Clostridium thermobutyricum TaxID=29372 RepID=N9XPT8_9CLOT|nr:hemolysin XhlA family protein [Clostridium thermobutyricum]ENZ01698.1 hypothetical protein HMPREF1092_00932 [Clostridium thermobutyricum]